MLAAGRERLYCNLKSVRAGVERANAKDEAAQRLDK